VAVVSESAALVALLRGGKRPWQQYSDVVEAAESALAVLRQEQGLLADDAADDELASAERDLDRWRAKGIRPLTVLDPGYPENLRGVHDRPPLIFVAGRLEPGDARSVAVVGARAASDRGRQATRRIAEHLVGAGYTVVSGLAEGIDTAAHTAALERDGRTVAVIGTGLERCYPPQNESLQRTIATRGAVVSQFWPDAPPSRRSFPMRNAVMSGLTLASVIVEAAHTSGSRMQARLALAQGRPVLLVHSLLSQPWARELAGRPGTHVVRTPGEVTSIVERLTSASALTP
jgi:DNA processing protein